MSRHVQLREYKDDQNWALEETDTRSDVNDLLPETSNKISFCCVTMMVVSTCALLLQLVNMFGIAKAGCVILVLLLPLMLFSAYKSKYFRFRSRSRFRQNVDTSEVI
jgi:hypothetical protein